MAMEGVGRYGSRGWIPAGVYPPAREAGPGDGNDNQDVSTTRKSRAIFRAALASHQGPALGQALDMDMLAGLGVVAAIGGITARHRFAQIGAT